MAFDAMDNPIRLPCCWLLIWKFGSNPFVFLDISSSSCSCDLPDNDKPCVVCCSCVVIRCFSCCCFYFSVVIVVVSFFVVVVATLVVGLCTMTYVIFGPLYVESLWALLYNHLGFLPSRMSGSLPLC
jgi:hypothetical protein